MTGVLIGTQEVRCVFGETAVVGTFTLRVFVLESEWQRQQNSSVTASHGEAAAVTSKSVCKSVYMWVNAESK